MNASARITASEETFNEVTRTERRDFEGCYAGSIEAETVSQFAARAPVKGVEGVLAFIVC
jgi:hypothetical protein